MAQEPLISIVVPIYNTEAYLPRCVQSLREQTYRNLEILLIDDGSPDGSGALCDRYAQEDSRIRVVHKENGGLSDARNCGMEILTGEWFTFVDSDDYVLPDYVSYLFGLARDFDCKMSVCGFDVHFSDGNRVERHSDARYAVSAKEGMERLFYDRFLTVGAWVKLYHRSLMGDIRFPVGRLFEDAGTTYRFLLSCDRIAVGEASQYIYAMRSESIVTSEFSEKKFDLVELSDRMCEETLALYPELEKAALRRKIYVRFSTLNQMLDTDRCPERKREMIRYIRRHGAKVFFDPKAPNRDRVALLMLALGYPVYRRAWKWYQKRFK